MDEVEQKELRAYRDLVRYIHYMAWYYGTPGHWMLDPEDMEAEGLMALTRCMKKYLLGKPYAEFLVLAKASVFHALKTLKYKAALTYRKDQMYELHLQDVDDDEQGGRSPYGRISEEEVPGGPDPSDLFDSQERLAALVNAADDLQLRVLEALLGGNDRMRAYFQLHRARRNWIYKDPVMEYTPLVIARTLCESEERVKGALVQLRKRYAEICKEV